MHLAVNAGHTCLVVLDTSLSWNLIATFHELSIIFPYRRGNEI